MFLKNVKYVISAPSKQYWLDGNHKEICIVGRSNVGKSTLINKITNNKSTAKVSSTPGYTKYLNFFSVNDSFYLVDTPGYGYARINYSRDEQFEKMMSEYIYQRENLVAVIMVIDGKVGLTKDDLLLLDMLHDAKRQVIIVASKMDKTNQSMKAKLANSLKNLLDEHMFNSILYYSSLNNTSVDKVVEKILSIYNS